MFKSRLKNNIFANLVGKIWFGLVQLVFVPVYIRLLGMEAFGLIGFFLILQGLLNLLDLGLSTTLNREVARRSGNDYAQEINDLVRTMEWIYWIVAVLIAASIVFTAPWIARSWVSTKGLPVESVQRAIALMGLVIGAQWPYSLYSGGLMGLQKQVLLNTIRVVVTTIQALGAIFVLMFISRSIEAYFIWQIIVLGIQTLLTGYFLRSALPTITALPTFNWDLLLGCWRFAAGVTGISAVVLVLTQVDKIILSKLLPLEYFGYYMLAFTVGGSLMFLVAPVSMALFPRLSELVAAGRTDELSQLYHKGCQIVSLFVFPAGILILFFPQEILMLWMQDTKIVEHTYLLLSVVIVGCVLSSIVTLPYMLQLAYGWTTLAFYKNIIAIIILIPLLLLLVHYFGVIGGATAWALLNAGYVLFEIPWMHRRLLRGEMGRWFFVDVGLPAVCCILLGIIFRMYFSRSTTMSMKLAALTISWGSMFGVCALALPFARNYFKKVFYGRL